MTGLALTLGPDREQVVVIGEWLYQDFRSLTHKYPVPEADIAGFVKPFTMQVKLVRLGTTKNKLSVYPLRYAPRHSK